MKISVVRIALLAAALAAQSQAQESARQLARVLAEKGVLNARELSAVEHADAEEAVRMLSAMLYEKGILTRSEIARVGGSGGVAPILGSFEAKLVPALLTTPVPGPVAMAAAPAVQQAAVAPAKPGGTTTSAAPAVTSAARFGVQVYGTALFNAFYNTAGTNIEDIPLLATRRGTDPYENSGMTARQSRFGLRYQGPDVFGAKLSGAAEIDMLGGKAPLANGVSMDLVRLRLAYGRLDWKNASIEAGQDWAVFSPLNPTSMASFAIPAMSASGNPWIRSPQFRAEFRSDASRAVRILFQVAALDPNVGDNTTAAVLDARAPGIGERGGGPAVETRLAVIGKIVERDASFGVSSHYNRGENVGTLAGATVTRAVDSWGVNLDYTVPFSKRFSLTGEAYTGRALGLFSVSSGQSVLPVGTVGEHGVGARGGWAQAQVNFSTRWQVNLVYGIEQMEQKNLRTGDRGKNQTYMTNFMYKLSPHITWALEWRRFLTDYRNQQVVNAIGDHVNLGIGYIF